MATNVRVIEDQTNPWGLYGGEEPQRSDLWRIIFDRAVDGINSQLNGVTQHQLGPIRGYRIASVSMPELSVRNVSVRRDSRVYQMPSWDEPPNVVKIAFVLEAINSISSPAGMTSLIIFLDRWRSLVRAGRGAVSQEQDIRLNENYRIDYAFPVGLWLLRGGSINDSARFVGSRRGNGSVSGSGLPGPAFSQQPSAEPAQNLASLVRSGGQFKANSSLNISHAFTLSQCWLGGYKINDLSYADTRTVLVDCTFYVEDIRLNENFGLRSMAEPVTI